MKISFHWLQEFVDIPDDAPTVGRKLTNVGLAVDSIENKAGDTVFEFDVTTNRPDCLHHLGMAREASAIYGGGLGRPQFQFRGDGEKRERVFCLESAVG